MTKVGRKFKKLSYLGVFLLTSGCAQSTTVNFALSISDSAVYAFSGEAFSPAPQFSVFKLKPSLPLETGYSGALTVTAYSDTSCKTAAAGTITATANPVSFSSGIAQFENFKFTWTSASGEGNVYFKGSTGGANYCTPGIPVLQHFNSSSGCVHSGSNGAAGTSTAATVLDQARVVRRDSDNRIVIAGTSINTSGGTEVAVWRYLANGTLDTSFSTVGYIHSGTTGAAGATGASVNDQVYDFQIDSQGRYVLVGSSVNASGGTELTLWRASSDGTLDTSFGSGGVVHTGNPGAAGAATAAAVVDIGYSLQISSSGRLIVAGSSKNGAGGTELMVRQFLGNGNTDATFGTAGIFISGTTGAAGATGASEFDRGRSLTLDSTGNLYIAGTSKNGSNGTELALWKLSSTGTLDTTWNSDGIFTSGTTGAAGATAANELEAAGQMILVTSTSSGTTTQTAAVVGSSKNTAGGTELALWRFTSTGALDTTFNTTGVVHFGTTGAAGATGASENDTGLSLGTDSSGKFVISGYSANTNGGKELALWRYSTTGSLDTSFDSDGSIHYGTTGTAGATGANTLDVGQSLLVDSLGTYLVVGSSKNTSNGIEMAAWRFLSTGVIIP